MVIATYRRHKRWLEPAAVSTGGRIATDRHGWWQAGWQLPPVETMVSLSLPPIQLAVGFVFGFFYFLLFIVFVFSQYYKCNTINAK
jgi:hypothetical protein